MGMTIVQKIKLHVFMVIPLFLIPIPEVTLSALLPLPIFSETLSLSSYLTQALIPTWSYSGFSCTRSLPNLNTLYLIALTCSFFSSPYTRMADFLALKLNLHVYASMFLLKQESTNDYELFFRQDETTKCIDLTYCKVRNIDVEPLLATLASGSDSRILRSVHICSIFQRFVYVLLCLRLLVVQNFRI